MRDRLITADASKVSASEFLKLFKPRITPAQAQLNIKFAEAFDLPINPEWVEQLTRVQGDPFNPPKWGKAA